MDLSVVTVTWNSQKWIAEQICSVISACKGLDFEQIIIDNNSEDDTRKIVSQEFSEVRLIKNDKNAGFAKANNQGVDKAKGEFVLFLNPDMKIKDVKPLRGRVPQGQLVNLLNWMRENPDVGIAGCKLVDESGKLNLEATPRRFPKVWEMILLFLKVPHLFPSVLNKYLYRNRDFEKLQEVDSVRGAFLLVRKKILDKLGFGFDPGYYMWFEDVDLCREVKKMGYKVMYNPIFSCVDHVGQSFKKLGSLKKQRIFFGSMIKYFKKWRF